MKHKRRRTRRREGLERIRLDPPLSVESEAAFYVEEEERGVYDDFWLNLGYHIEHGANYPPYPSPREKRPNNRARSWSGTFAFAFCWKDIDHEGQEDLLRTLSDVYQCNIVPGEGMGPWIATAQLNGKRVKSLTRLLNRRYAKQQLIWKEL
jgi:hypothetical protein